jgi:hypothetical protein
VPEVAEIHARHREGDHEAVVLGHQGDRDPRLVQRLVELATEVVGAVSPGREPVDVNDGVEIAGVQVADAGRGELDGLVGLGQGHAGDERGRAASAVRG